MSGFILNAMNECTGAAKVLVAAEYVGVEVKVNNDYEKNEEFLARFPFGKAPALDSNEGPVYESDVIMKYIARSGESDAGLFGQNSYEKALVEQWIQIGTTELSSAAYDWIAPVLEQKKYNGQVYNQAKEQVLKVLNVLENHFVLNTFLVGHQVTLADIALVCILKPLFDLVIDENTQYELPHVVRWYATCRNQPQFSCLGEYTLAVEEKKAQSKKKKAQQGQGEKKKKKEKKSKKPKDPLDELPASSTGMNIDGTKRLFSNDEFPAAIQEFWDKWDNEGFSIYTATYNYNSENAVLFMTCNLVGGYIQRLDALRPYGYGALLVTGNEEGPFTIETVWIFRGTDIPRQMQETSDTEYYSWNRLDVSVDGPDRQRFAVLWNAPEVDGLPVQERRFFK